MEIEDVIIDDEFRTLLDPLEDLSRLRNKILLEGWSDEPITVWLNHRILLDGHNRYRLWQEQQEAGDDLGAPPIRELPFADREKAKFWIVNNQLARRNLRPETIAYLLGEKYEATKAANGGEREGAGRPRKSVRQSGGLNKERKEEKPYAPYKSTATKIAKEHGVSPRKVERSAEYAKAVNKLDAEGVVNKADVLSGRTRIPMARVIKAANVETPEEAKQVIEAPAAKTEAPSEDLSGLCLVAEIRRLRNHFAAIDLDIDKGRAAELLNELETLVNCDE